MKPKNLIEDVAAQAASCRLMRAMQSANRYQVLSILSKTEMAVGMLVATVKVSQPAMSQILGDLRRDGLVTARRDGMIVYYSCQSTAVHSLLRTIDEIFPIKPSNNRLA